MKRFTNIILLLSFTMAGCYSTGQLHRDQGYYETPQTNYRQEVTYQTFYDELQPYGTWVDYPGYGYVWQPRAGAGFRPYETSGHWVSTVDGWAWASDYSWGWAPFHYGRWLNAPGMGWAWVPGYEWAPAWVTWGQYNNYYAWAPLAPGISISIGHSWRAPANYWSYVPNNCLLNRNIGRYTVRNNPAVVNNIVIINNYNTYNNSNYYHRGPAYQQVEQYTHRVIRPAAIASTDRPGVTRVDNDNRLEVFRPAISQTSNTNLVKPSRAVAASSGQQNTFRRQLAEVGAPDRLAVAENTRATESSAVSTPNSSAGLQQTDNNRAEGRIQRKPILQGSTGLNTTIQENLNENANTSNLPATSTNVEANTRINNRNRNRNQAPPNGDDNFSRPYVNPRATDRSANEERNRQMRIMQQPDNSFRNRELQSASAVDAAELRRQNNREARRLERREQSTPVMQSQPAFQAPRQQEVTNSRPIARPTRKNRD